MILPSLKQTFRFGRPFADRCGPSTSLKAQDKPQGSPFVSWPRKRSNSWAMPRVNAWMPRLWRLLLADDAVPVAVTCGWHEVGWEPRPRPRLPWTRFRPAATARSSRGWGLWVGLHPALPPGGQHLSDGRRLAVVNPPALSRPCCGWSVTRQPLGRLRRIVGVLALARRRPGAGARFVGASERNVTGTSDSAIRTSCCASWQSPSQSSGPICFGHTLAWPRRRQAPMSVGKQRLSPVANGDGVSNRPRGLCRRQYSRRERARVPASRLAARMARPRPPRLVRSRHRRQGPARPP